MDSDDEREVAALWAEFERKYFAATEKVCAQFFKKMEKQMTHVLGLRGRNPLDEEARYYDFLAWVDNVYLKPSLE